MKIAVFMVACHEAEVLLDTIESIRTFITEDIVVVIDEIAWPRYAKLKVPFKLEKGFFHNTNKAPYKNMCLSLMKAKEYYPDADWYWYLEPDVLIVNENYKSEIERFNHCWLIGCDHRHDNKCNLSLLSEVTGIPALNIDHTVLGCCQILKNEFVQKLSKLDFFNKFLEVTKEFQGGYFPGYTYYAFEETLFATLAVWMGKHVASLSSYEPLSSVQRGRGDYKKYVIRFGVDLSPRDIYPCTSIIHPIKRFNDPIRNYFRDARLRYKKNVEIKTERVKFNGPASLH